MFFMGYPYLDGAKYASSAVTNGVAKLRYGTGAAVELSITNSAMVLRFKSVPEGVENYKLELHMSAGFGARKVKWAINDESGAFPRDISSPESGKTLYKGKANDFAVFNPDGTAFAMRFPDENALMELRDVREWQRIILTYVAPIPTNAPDTALHIPFGADPAFKDFAPQ